MYGYGSVTKKISTNVYKKAVVPTIIITHENATKICNELTKILYHCGFNIVPETISGKEKVVWFLFCLCMVQQSSFFFFLHAYRSTCSTVLCLITNKFPEVEEMSMHASRNIRS